MGRWGGDEFAALLVGTDSIEGAVVTAERLIKRLDDPIWTGSELVQVGISVGIALFPVHGRDAKALLANADHAMYRAKYGGSGFAVYEETPLRAPALRQTSLISQALERNEFFLEYQPKIDLSSREVIGVEALVRWRSPHWGVLGPTQFIPAAEKTSVIRPMNYSIIDMALSQVAAWQRQGIFLPVAVNLSAAMLEDKDICTRISDGVSRHGLANIMLMIEIAETALEYNPSRRQMRLNELIEAGLHISIDDFGTGFTSLKYLRDIEVSEIKIDRLFVSELEARSRDASIVRSIATLASGIKVPVVAEGMEQAASWNHLVELGCDMGQGFHICRPIEPERIPAWLASWNRETQSMVHA
jgi:predicted signal transduction protein with EAL and GGDEF domain